MQQNDMSSPYFQYYQSHLQNPNTNPIDPLLNSNYNPNPLPTTSISQASAPPVSSNYSTSDYSNYYFPPYPQNNTDHVYSNPNLQQSDASNPPYSFTNQPTSYYPYDLNQAAVNYDPNSSFTSTSYSQGSYNGSNPPNYENPNQGGTNYGGYSDEFNGDGVYRYNGGKVEPYGAQGGRSESSKGLAFDDYGRPINVTNGNELKGTETYNSKIVKAVPKIDIQQDASSGVQKFRVKILSEGGGQTDMDVLCQIGLDGIRILDPTTSRILRIYQLETVTRWEVLDSYIFAFWVKSSIDIEPRRIRLKSNSYTTNNVLDTVAAASIQLKEMAESNKPSDPTKESESEKKKGFTDWMNLVKPGNEEKDHWVPDEAVTKCAACRTDFGAFVRRHHCRNCGDIFCDKCTQGRIGLTADESAQPVRVCDRCMAEITQRLSNAKEVTAKVTGLQSHEDLAKKLQEVMDKNRKTSTGLMPIGSDTRMREVECPTCTVHLQVKVPASGSETIECSVCRHPFLVSAQ